MPITLTRRSVFAGLLASTSLAAFGGKAALPDAPLTLSVNLEGSNGAFRTIQQAMDYAAQQRFSRLTINLAPGTYASVQSVLPVTIIGSAV